jgi:hypothetical protein
MPRFHDEWLMDRVLFDYVNGGTCSCCSLSSAIFLPGGTAQLIQSVSDLDTDQMTNEIQSLVHHPWPQDLRDHVWASRVKLRQKLKHTMKVYDEFWKNHTVDDVIEWCITNGSLLQRIFQLSRTEIMDLLENQYNIHSAYQGVLDAVIDQVAHFHLTNYPTDARGDESEIQFEHALAFNRYQGFHIEIIMNDNDENHHHTDQDVLQIWINRMKSLRGPKLLSRHSSRANPNDQEDDGDDVDGPPNINGSKNLISSTGPGFQSDRRMIRLIIARYWADLLIQKYCATATTKQDHTTPIEDAK